MRTPAKRTEAAPPATTAAASPGSSPSTGLVARVSSKFGVDADKMLQTLKDTAFRQKPPRDNKPVAQVTNEHMMMLLIVAEQLNLNPFLKELYAFPQDGGIVAMVSIDGWLRIINEHPQFDWMTIEIAEPGTDAADAWASCEIKRKDRAKPVKILEFLAENARETDPWSKMPRRMLRHRAIIQCARIVFGFGRVYDPDEGEKVYMAERGSTFDHAPNVRGSVAAPRRKSELAELPPGPSDSPEPPQPDPEPTQTRLSVDQRVSIHDKLREEGVAESEFLARLEVGRVDEIPAGEYETAIALIDELSKATG